MATAKQWLSQQLVELGWVGLDDVVEYISKLDSLEEIQIYMTSLLGDTPVVVDLAQRFSSMNLGSVDSTVASSSAGKKAKRRERKRAIPSGKWNPATEGNSNETATAAGGTTRVLTTLEEGDVKRENQDLQQKISWMHDRIREARESKRVVNCLACGRIHYKVPEDGECLFCHESLFPPDVQLSSEAMRRRDLLIEYERTSAKRTAVYDDESDYFNSTSDFWMSTAEKEEVEKGRIERKAAEEEERRVVTIDINVGTNAGKESIIIDRTKKRSHRKTKKEGQVIPPETERRMADPTEKSTAPSATDPTRILPRDVDPPEFIPTQRLLELTTPAERLRSPRTIRRVQGEEGPLSV